MIEQAAIIAVIVGVVEVVKRLGLKSKFAPLLSLVLGVCAGVFFNEALALLTLPEQVFAGLVLGLSSSGLYSGTRAALNK